MRATGRLVGALLLVATVSGCRAPVQHESAVAAPVRPAAPAAPASPAPPAPVPWEAVGNGAGYMVGDSLTQQCPFAIGPRGLGRVGWPGGGTTDTTWLPDDPSTQGDPKPLWTRLHDTSGLVYPFTTDPPEAARWRDSGWKVVALGTNDAKFLTPAQFRVNVQRFVDDAHGRPLIWVNAYNRPFDAQVRALNAVLADVAATTPSMRVLDWYGYVSTHRSAGGRPLLLPDGVHLATSSGCHVRMRLIEAAMPAEPGAATAVGAWTAGSPHGSVSGYAADQSDPRRPAQVQVRVDGALVATVAATGATTDPYAEAADARSWSVPVPAGRHLVQVTLLAANGTTTDLGSRHSR